MVFKWILNQGEKSQKEKMPFFFFLNKKERKRMMKSGLIRESFRWRINTRERVIGPDPQRSYFLEKKRIYILPYSIDSGFSLNIIFKIFLKKKKEKRTKNMSHFYYIRFFIHCWYSMTPMFPTRRVSTTLKMNRNLNKKRKKKEKCSILSRFSFL
jgi:hypothetical protein